jgi:hypothetical protein
MSEQQHTKGPWECQINAEEHTGTVEIVAVNAAMLVARVYGPDDLGANARLIAAAPCLLKALKDMTSIARAALFQNDTPRARERLARAEAAIARAEGRTK